MKCHGIGGNGKPVSDTFVSTTGTKSYIYSLNKVKHNCLIKILVTGSLYYIHLDNMFRSSSDHHQVYNELKMQRAKHSFSTQWDPIVLTLLYKTR